jgi:Phage endonuclease I
MRSLLVEASYRNSFEAGLGEQLAGAGIDFGYETLKLEVSYPPRKGRYTPDLIPHDCNIIIEGKGYFYNKAADRQKLILVKEQHPELDIRLVFQNASTKIYKGSKTTYGQWATDHGFRWSDKGIIPPDWLKEIKDQQNGKSRRKPASQPTGSQGAVASRRRKH